jgi:starch synthase
LNILFVSSEVAPYAKTGGLADVAAALPRYLHRAGHDVRVFLPLYDRIDRTKENFSVVIEGIEVRLGAHRFEMKVVTAGSAPQIFFLHCPELYARGSIYTSDSDEHLRFLALEWGALSACQRMSFAPDIIHCNDWQSALIPVTLKTRFSWDRLFAKSRTLLTIHNLNYQGGFSSKIAPDTNLADSMHLFHQELLAQGRINFLLHGILYADGISTVSPTYARQIQGPEHGAGLDGFLRTRSSTVVGILNGVDYDEWSPERDKHVPHTFSSDDLAGKERNKEALLTSLGLPYRAGVPLFGIVSRLASQKGFDLVEEVMPALLVQHGFQLVVLGNGEGRIEEFFGRLQANFPRQVCFYRGFSNPLAHLIEAGADIFLMPSRYEPCGLNQMYSLRYGTVPIVHRTGGLADTVHLWNPRTGEGTGFPFDHFDGNGLRFAIEAALASYRDGAAWKRLMHNGMAEDFSWDAQGKLYEQLYSRL